MNDRTRAALLGIVCFVLMAVVLGAVAEDRQRSLAAEVRMKDADTAAVTAPLLVTKLNLRLAGVNAAETSLSQARIVCARAGLGDACVQCELAAGEKAKAWAQAWTAGKVCVVELVDGDPDYGGRYEGDLICNGERQTEAGIRAGHLRRSEKARKAWCAP